MEYLPCPGEKVRIVAIAPEDAFWGDAATLVGRTCRVGEMRPSTVVQGHLCGECMLPEGGGWERELYFAAVQLAPLATARPVPVIRAEAVFDAWL